MKVEEINNHTLYGIDQGIMTETVIDFRQTPFHSFKIPATHLLLTRKQFHDGVLEESEMPLHSVVALWSGNLNKLLGNVNHIYYEIIALSYLLHQVTSPGHDETVARLKAEQFAILHKRAESLMTIGVTQIAGKPAVAYARERIFYYYMLHRVHTKAKIRLFLQKW